MQTFNFGIRNSAAPSVDDNQSRYVPSSVYSGPGPAEESATPVRQSSNGVRGPAYGKQESRFQQTSLRPKTSMMLNMNDPISMHLLMETAMIDSKDFEVLSFEELEHLKKERSYLKTKIEGVRRQLGLEKKMKDAAQSLNRLTSTRGKTGEDLLDPNANSKPQRGSIFSRKSQKPTDTQDSQDDEIQASQRRIDKLSIDLGRLERNLEDVERRILHHTAGVLQMTHKGLKKNVRKNELPRSPESMASQTRSLNDGSSDFDERSLYQVPDYVHDLGAPASQGRVLNKDSQSLEDVAVRLHNLNAKLHMMIQQASMTAHFERPPEPTDEGLQGRVGAQIQAHLTYMLQGMEALEASSGQANSHTDFDNQQMEAINEKLNGMIAKTNSVAKSPVIPDIDDRGRDFQSQLAFFSTVLDRLNSRIDALIEQKDILTRQIQQQRELNTKSDAQRDAQIRDLTEELEEVKQLQNMSEQELQQSQDQISLLMEQLDRVKQDEVLNEQQKSMQDSTALDSERAARREAEAKFTAELQAKQDDLARLQADHAKIKNDFELRSQQHIQQLNEATTAKSDAEINAQKHSAEAERVQTEMANLESQVIQLQTELTMAKAELDGAYGTRAQRANDVAMNPEIRKQIDTLNAENGELRLQLEHLSEEHETKGAGSAELQNRVNALQKELKETIEDYEVMTKNSIDSEKERDQLEATIDTMRDKCDALETQISEEKVKWIGVKPSLPTETTSTMVLKNEFKKMMRESRAESIKAIRAEQDERKRLEGVIKAMRRDAAQNTPIKAPSRSATMPDATITVSS